MLVRMEFRKSPERPSNRFGTDDGERPHDDRAEEAWVIEAREAVARKLILGCNVPPQELKDARLTMKEARVLAVDIERRIESNYHRLVNPPEPKDVEVPVFTYVPEANDRVPQSASPLAISEAAPEQPAPKRRRRKRDTKTLMRAAIARRHEERDLFND